MIPQLQKMMCNESPNLAKASATGGCRGNKRNYQRGRLMVIIFPLALDDLRHGVLQIGMWLHLLMNSAAVVKQW